MKLQSPMRSRKSDIIQICRSLMLLAFALVATARCETRFSESAPSSVETNGMTLDQRVAAKARIDLRLEQVKVNAQQVKSLIATFRSAHTQGLAGQIYTPIDFLLDLNEALAGRIPEHRGIADSHNTQVVVRNAVVRIPIESLSEECRNVQTQLRTELKTDSQSQTLVTETGIQYLIKTCKTNDEFVPVVSANWSVNSMTLAFNNVNLSTLFQDIVKSKLTSNGVCQTDLDTSGILRSVACQNMQVGLSSSEFSVIRSLKFSNVDVDRFSLSFEIFDRETGRLKGTTDANLDSNGRLDFKAHKEASAEAEPANARPEVLYPLGGSVSPAPATIVLPPPPVNSEKIGSAT